MTESRIREIFLSRFVKSIEVVRFGCWLWHGARNRSGYARFRGHDSQSFVHRWAYQLMVGRIEEGMTLDHLCRVRRCVNPMHMEVVTLTENVWRARNGLPEARMQFLSHLLSKPSAVHMGGPW